MKVNFTVGAIAKMTCPPGAQQAFLSDTAVPGLLRVHHTAGEAWMLEQAGIEFKPMVERKLAVAK